MKAKFMIFDTDFQAAIFDKQIKNGFVEIGDKEFSVDNAQPFLIGKEGLFGRLFGGFTPLYLLKWNVIIPVGFRKMNGREKLIDTIGKLQDESLRNELSDIIKIAPENAEKEVEYRTLESIELKFPENDMTKKVITPELLKSTTDMRFLKNFKKYAGEGGGGGGRKKWMDIMFIAIIGFGIFFALGFSGIIKL